MKRELRVTKWFGNNPLDLLFLFLFLLGIIGCFSEDSSGPLPVRAVIEIPTEIRVTEADNGKKVGIRVGDTLIVALGSSPSTGYDWEARTVDTKYLELQETYFISTGPYPGSEGIKTIKYKAKAAGTTDYLLWYRRATDQANTYEQKFSVQMVVFK